MRSGCSKPRRRKRGSVFVIRILAAITFVAPISFVQQTPPRDARPVAQAGTAIIRGRVVAAEDDRPLRRVQLKFTSQSRTTSTDEDGRYEMTNLPAGRYTVTASRGGFLSLRYRPRRPRGQGKF